MVKSGGLDAVGRSSIECNPDTVQLNRKCLN